MKCFLQTMHGIITSSTSLNNPLPLPPSPDFLTQEILNFNAKLVTESLVSNFLALVQAYVYTKRYHNELFLFSNAGRHFSNQRSETTVPPLLYADTPISGQIYLKTEETKLKNFTSTWPCCITSIYLNNKTNWRTNFQIYSGTKLYKFRTVSLPIIRS